MTLAYAVRPDAVPLLIIHWQHDAFCATLNFGSMTSINNQYSLHREYQSYRQDMRTIHG
jgi:hypothetical protein